MLGLAVSVTQSSRWQEVLDPQLLLVPSWPGSEFYCEIFILQPFEFIKEFKATITPLFGITSFFRHTLILHHNKITHFLRGEMFVWWVINYWDREFWMYNSSLFKKENFRPAEFEFTARQKMSFLGCQWVCLFECELVSYKLFIQRVRPRKLNLITKEILGPLTLIHFHSKITVWVCLIVSLWVIHYWDR